MHQGSGLLDLCLHYVCVVVLYLYMVSLCLNQVAMDYCLLRTPPCCSVEINVFELGWYFTILHVVIVSLLARTPLLGF